MPKRFTDLNNTITEIVNNTEKLRSLGKKGNTHFVLGFAMSWKVDEAGRCAKALPEDTSSTEKFCTSSANVILDGQRRGLWLLSQEAGMSSKEETGAGSQHERREGWAAPWSQAGSCFTHPVSVPRGYHHSSREQCQNKMWPYLRCLQMRNKCIVLLRCLVCLNLLMPNNVRI